MDFIFDPSLVLYLPLYELDGSPFMSKDAYGHLCTVAGAVWKYNGRWFDGTDDDIAISSTTLSLLNSDHTILMWLNFDDVTAHKGLFLQETNTADDNYSYWNNDGSIYWRPDKAGGGYVNYNKAWSPSDSTWYLVAWRKSGDDWEMLIDAVSLGIVTDSSAMISTINNTTFGKNGGTRMKGLIGEILMYSRALSNAEIQQYIQATKWRYK